MVNFNSDEEAVDAIKKWWDENGKSVIVGAVIGLSLVYGWRYYGEYQAEQAAMASDAYVALQQDIQSKDQDLANKQWDVIKTEHAGSVYAVLSALELAKTAIEANDLTKAEEHLTWAKDQASDVQIKQIASLRLARVLTAQEKWDEAKQLVDTLPNDKFRGEASDIKGDIARAKQDFPAAKLAYQEALANDVSNADLVKMKMDDLGITN